MFEGLSCAHRRATFFLMVCLSCGKCPNRINLSHRSVWGGVMARKALAGTWTRSPRTVARGPSPICERPPTKPYPEALPRSRPTCKHTTEQEFDGTPPHLPTSSIDAKCWEPTTKCNSPWNRPRCGTKSFAGEANDPQESAESCWPTKAKVRPHALEREPAMMCASTSRNPAHMRHCSAAFDRQSSSERSGLLQRRRPSLPIPNAARLVQTPATRRARGLLQGKAPRKLGPDVTATSAWCARIATGLPNHKAAQARRRPAARRRNHRPRGIPPACAKQRARRLGEKRTENLRAMPDASESLAWCI